MRRILFALLLCALPLASPQAQTLPLTGIQVPTAVANVLNDFVDIKSACLLIQNQTAGSGTTPAVNVLQIALLILHLQSDWNTLTSTTTIENAAIAYVQNQFANTGITTTTLTTTFNAAGSLLTAIETDYPHDAANPPHLLDRTFSNGLVNVLLSAAQLPNTMTAITNYLATLS